MNTQIISDIIGVAILVLVFVEIRRKAPAIEQDAAAMERKAMADLHALWLDEITRSRAMADHAAQDAQHARDVLGEKLDRMMVSINREFVPIHAGLGALRVKIDEKLAPKPATQPESPLPDVNSTIHTPAATAAAPDTPEAADPDGPSETSAGGGDQAAPQAANGVQTA